MAGSNHYINIADYAQLRARLRAVAKLDENADEDGGYKIRRPILR